MLDFNSVLGIALTIILPFGVIGFASVVRKLGASVEISRKLVHILLSNWILLALEVYNTAWACVVPACFVILNYLSFHNKFFSAIERDNDNSLGTVWYALSLFLLCLVGYFLNVPWIAACGMLAMGYGDGIGALIGKRWGKLHFTGIYSKKSLEGTFAVMLFSGLSVWFVCTTYANHLSPRFTLIIAISCAISAAVIELFSPLGIDNLTLPLSVSFIVFLLIQYPLLWQIFICLDITLFILVIAYYLQAISFSGLQAATLLGVSLFIFGGWISFYTLILFFILGSLVSHIGKAKKSSATILHERRGARSIAQVLANGLPALIFAILYYFTDTDACLLAVLACFASTTADTFSSEIGMLSDKDPISILTLKPIQRGMSGGVTLLGFLGAILGACIISFIALPKFGILGMLAIILTGLANSLLDSILGATFQAKYQIPTNNNFAKQLTERRDYDGTPLKLVKGLKWVNNDVVNFISVLICGLFLILLY